MTTKARTPGMRRFVVAASVMVLAAFGTFGPLRSDGASALLPADEISARLVLAYPDFVVAKADGVVRVRGQDVDVDPALTKGSVSERMAGATLGDQFSIPYEQGCGTAIPGEDDDPGRLRHEAFFRAMYGSSRTAVAKNLTTVKWFGSTMTVTNINGVDKALAAVAKELAVQPEWRQYLTPPGGSFNWRRIAGEQVLSMHSFGIAVDLNVKFSDYWRWSGGVKKYVNRIPCGIAEVFERHGFIWGAKWFHFDSMHFEYRPELLVP